MARKRLAKHRGFPPNLYLNAAGYFYYVRPGDKKVKGLGRDKARAFTQARAANAALAAVEKTSLVDWVLGKAGYTVAEWLPVYRDLWIERSESPHAKNTIRNCDAYLKRIAETDYSWRQLADVQTVHVASHITNVAKNSGVPTAGQLRARLQDVFRMAEAEGHIPVGRNPVAATYTPEQKVKRERLTLEQFVAIREVAPTWLRRAMNLALVTCQRREDVTNFEFPHFRDGHLHVIQGKSGGDTRLRLDGRIYMKAINMTIEQAVLDCRDHVVSRFVLHHVRHVARAKPGEKLSPGHLSNGFADARALAGISAAEGRTAPSFHEIRSLGERLYREQYGADFAQAILGHKNAATTAKYDDLRGQGWDIVSSGVI